MHPAPIPANEGARLMALWSLHILDTAPEERFDRIARIAKRLLDAPIALVSLVDADRQWSKSKVGIEATQTPRDHAFCSHAVSAGETLWVEDATRDPRFFDNPLVLEEPNIRFYAGVPIASPDGYLIGTLCVIDTEPRAASEDQLEILRDLAKMVEHEIATLRLAVTDDLTGLLNRRGFAMFYDQLERIAARNGKPLSLMLIDFDGLKRINDSLGHDKGDSALCELSKAIVDTFRDCDVVARIGGDEFCAAMLDTASATAASPRRRLERNIDSRNRFAAREMSLSVSAGLSISEPDARLALDKMLEFADRSMYEEKRLKYLHESAAP
jgi:diguanylate cyclase (GGDEF)-like protein